MNVPIGVRSMLSFARHALIAGVFSIVCIALRHHLFVWSVVSPKYLYIIAAVSLPFVYAVSLAVLSATAKTSVATVKSD